MNDDTYVMLFSGVGAEDLLRVGGKGANLGVLCAGGLPVPGGFCLTTAAYRQFVAGAAEFPRIVQALEETAADDVAAVRELGEELRAHLRSTAIPRSIERAVLAAWRELGPEDAYAVRSSATAEDLPGASFAGQQDTYLNVLGEAALLDRVRACWASLYTDRAILYRRKNLIPHVETALCVVVQRMVAPATSGILFTADPVTGHRRRIVIDAGYGLGEALVSGLINADLYRIDRRDGAVLERRLGDQHLEIVSLPGGGTEERPLAPRARSRPVLDDRQLASLVALGERVEALYFGVPQDIEWCFSATGELFIVQSRPITTLFPRMDPAPEGDHLEVGFSIGHAQMMTDAMKPLGRSTIKQVLPIGRRMNEPGESPWLRTAGGRLYADLGPMLRRGPLRRMILSLLPNIDPLAAKALGEVASRPELRERGPRVRLRLAAGLGRFVIGNALAWLTVRSPEGSIDRFTAQIEADIAGVRARIDAEAEPAQRLRVCLRELGLTLDKVVYIMPGIVAGLIAGRMLRKLCAGYEAQITALGRGLHGNVTTAMDLEVGDLADIARRHPAVKAALLSGVGDLGQLAERPGGEAFVESVRGFLQRYGMRGPGEFDLTRPRWRDDPASLLSMIAGNLGHAEPGLHRAHHERLQAASAAAAEELSALSWGPKRALIGRLVRLHRTMPAAREHPKYFFVRVMGRVRQEVLEAGRALAQQGRIGAAEDVFFLDYHELIDAVADGSTDLHERVAGRIEEHRRDQARTPPRVLTSEGESPQAHHSDDVPSGALAGSGVSAGVVEGIARVVTDPVGHVLVKGEILVAPFTDPGWTPLFINAAGVVIEVGGMMTHGSVIAREYGIPAVVSVPGATTLLRTGQRIRVNGDEGWAMVIADEAPQAPPAGSSSSQR